MSSKTCELIVYACPTGVLGTQLEYYFQLSEQACGSNTAHRYMPHCTLTGFFHDTAESVPTYTATLECALQESFAISQPEISLAGIHFKPRFHFLSVRSPWLESFTALFAELADSETRTDDIRVKSDLHISLAYGFDGEKGDALQAIAEELIDRQAEISWELRFYERSPSNDWTLFKSWELPTNSLV